MTEQQREGSADVPEDVPQSVKTDPQSENVDEKGSGESQESLPEEQEVEPQSPSRSAVGCRSARSRT